MKQKLIKYLFLIFFLFSNLHPETLEHLLTSTSIYTGGASIASGGSAYNIPAGSSTYIGNIWVPFGLTFASGADATINITAPVSGAINLNSGTMTLDGDLILLSDVTFASYGKINGQGNTIEFFDDINLNSVLKFTGDVIINGNNNRPSLGDSGQLLIDSGVTVTLQNLILEGLHDSPKIIMDDTDSVLSLDNVIAWLDDDYSLTQGELHIHNDVSISGSGHIFGFESANGCFIDKNSQLSIEHGVTFSYDGAANNYIYMTDDTSHIYLNSCNVYANQNGMLLTDGTVLLDGLVTLSADGQDSSSAIKLTTAILNPSANARVYGFVDLTTAYDLGTESHFLFMDESSKVKVNQDIDVFCPRSFFVDGAYRTLSAGTYDINDTYSFLCKEFYALTDNIDHGPGDIDINTTTTITYDLWLSKHHKLNVDTSGGDIVLNGSTHFIHFARELGERSGLDPLITINGGNKLTLENIVLKDFAPRYIDLQDGSTILFGNRTTMEIPMNVEIDPNYTISCDGLVNIHGFGNKISGHFNSINMSTTNEAITALDGAEVFFRKINLMGLADHNLRLMTDGCDVTIQDCCLILFDDYSFDKGVLYIEDTCPIEGQKIFGFDTNAGEPGYSRRSEVRFNSTLKIDLNSTFSFGCNQSQQLNLKYNYGHAPFVNNNSAMFFEGAIFHVTDSGFAQYDGLMLFDHVNTLKQDSSTPSSSILFGYTGQVEILDIVLLPDSEVKFIRGKCRIRNPE